MKQVAAHSVVLVLMAVIAACSIGCSDDATEPSGEKSPYRDLTEREDCITNLVVSHMLMNIERYAEILHEDYIYYGKKWGEVGDELGTFNRAEDIDFTAELFQNAVCFDLEIPYGIWAAVDKIGEEPCTDCWETTREFHLQFTLQGEDRIYMAHDLVKYIVVPVDDDGTTEYRIRLGCDVADYLGGQLPIPAASAEQHATTSDR